MTKASARTDTGLPLAFPTRAHRAGSRRPNTARFDARSPAKSSASSASGLLVVGRLGDVVVLVEAGQRRLVPAADAERAVAEDPLPVADVAEDLPDAPFPRRVAEGLAAGGDGAGQPPDLGRLGREDGQDVRPPERASRTRRRTARTRRPPAVGTWSRSLEHDARAELHLARGRHRGPDAAEGRQRRLVVGGAGKSEQAGHAEIDAIEDVEALDPQLQPPRGPQGRSTRSASPARGRWSSGRGR